MVGSEYVMLIQALKIGAPDDQCKYLLVQSMLLSRMIEFYIGDSILLRRFNRQGGTIIASDRFKVDETRYFYKPFSTTQQVKHYTETKCWAKYKRDTIGQILMTTSNATANAPSSVKKIKPPPMMPVAPMQPYGCSRPFELMSMDICGPYQTHERDNKFKLVITDYFTKWVEENSIPDQEAVTFGFCFKSFVNTFEYPDVILNDQG